MGMGAGEGKHPTQNGRSYGQILEGGNCGSHINGDDNRSIEKFDGSPPGRPHGAATGLSPGWLVANRPLDIKAEELRGSNTLIPSPLPPHPPGEGNRKGSDWPSVLVVENMTEAGRERTR